MSAMALGFRRADAYYECVLRFGRLTGSTAYNRVHLPDHSTRDISVQHPGGAHSPAQC